MLRKVLGRLAGVTVFAALIAAGTILYGSAVHDRSSAAQSSQGFIINCTFYPSPPVVPNLSSPPLGVACDNHGNVQVALAGSTSITATVSQPYNGTGGEPLTNSSFVGTEAIDPSGLVTPIHVNTNGALIVRYDAPLPVQSGNCFTAISGTAGGCINGAATPVGCAAGPALPCGWDLHLAGKILVTLTYISPTGEATDKTQLNCWDSNTNSGTLILSGGVLAAGQSYPFNYGFGRKLTNDGFCQLADNGGGSVLASNKAFEVGYTQ